MMTVGQTSLRHLLMSVILKKKETLVKKARLGEFIPGIHKPHWFLRDIHVDGYMNGTKVDGGEI